MLQDKILIDEPRLNNRIKEIAKQIEEKHKGEELVLICILKGAVYFAVDLSKKITQNVVTLDFMKASSYGNERESSGKINISLDISENIENKNVIIVEDIIDTGFTLNYIYDYLKSKNPKSLEICVLLNKKARRVQDIKIDYVGFEIDNYFVVGYGFDYNQQYRNLPYIGYVE